MKQFELYFIRIVIIMALAIIAVSPFLALSHWLHGLANGALNATHLLALGYILLIGFCLFMISPVFGDSKHRT